MTKKIKSFDIDKDSYVFETIDELVEMLKEDGYMVRLNIKKKNKIKGCIVTL